jgi:hypothetical protein
MMRTIAGGFLVLLLACGMAQGDVVNWVFPLDGDQEVPPVATPATGTGEIWFDTVSSELSWSVSYQDLLGTISAAHFHGPAPVGVNTGVQVGSTIGPSPLTGGPVVLSGSQASDLLAGLWYFNIHTNLHPGGEIRGQVVPEPASLVLLGAAAAGMMLMRRRRGRV